MRQLIFQELEMENFKVHEHMTFSFVPNRFVTITGNNGQGKTTIFSALAWALYDQTIEGVSGDEIVRKRSGKDTYVRVTWMDGEDQYEVKAYRKHHKHKNARFLYKNGVDITSNKASDTLKTITNLIMPKDIFFNCLLFSQYVKNHFVDLTASDQNDILDTMLLLHRFKKWYDKCSDFLKIEEEAISTLCNDKTIHEGAIKSAKTSLDMEAATIESATTNYLEQRLFLESKKELLERRLQELSHTEDDNEDSIREKIKQCIATISELESNIQNQREICRTELNTLAEQKSSEATILESKTQNDILMKTKDITEQRNSVISEKQIAETRKQKLFVSLETNANSARERDRFGRDSELGPIIVQSATLDTRIVELNQSIPAKKKQLDQKVAEKKKYEDELKKPNPICVACGQTLRSKEAIDHIEKHIRAISEDIKAIEEQINEIEGNVSSCTITKDTLEQDKARIISKWNSADSTREIKIQTKKNEIESEHNELINSLLGKIKLLDDEVAKVKADFERIKENSLGQIESKFLNLSKDCKDKNQNIALAWSTETSEVKQEKSILEQALRGKQEINLQIQECQKELHEIAVSLEQKKIARDETILTSKNKIAIYTAQSLEHESVIRNTDEMIMKLRRRKDIISFWKTGFSDSGIKSMLLDESIPKLNEKARELCDLFPTLKVRFDSQTTLKSGDFRNKFSIGVLQTRNLSALKELSAGEKRMADIIILLCLRHLLEYVQDTRMNILLLDEILDSLDPENSALAVAMVKKLSSDHCVVLISHTLRDFIEADEAFTL